MTETIDKNIVNLKYQRAVVDHQKGKDPQTNVETNEPRTITVNEQLNTINIRIVPRPSMQNETQNETS